MVTINNRGLTLLEILITLAILGIIIISFISLFTSTNLNINYSGKKVEVVRETKSILDEINSKVTYSQNESGQDLENIIKKVLEDRGYQNSYRIFDNDNELYKYNKRKIHCLIEEQKIYIEPNSNLNNITLNMQKIKIVFFYDNGERNVQLSTYIPIEGR